jgi:hypothetical protein
MENPDFWFIAAGGASAGAVLMYLARLLIEGAPKRVSDAFAAFFRLMSGAPDIDHLTRRLEALRPASGIRFTVTVRGCTPEQALKVMRERINHDEDLGFDYKIEFAPDERL